LKLKDVVTENGEIVDEISIERRYMKKKLHGRTVAVNPGAREVILFWVSRLYEKGFRHKDTALFCKDNGKAISRIDAWKIINAAKKMAGLKGKIATHSMRKTYGTNAHAELMRRNAAGESIDVLLETADMLGHSDPKSTMSYLPRNPKRRREVINAISILPERTEES
jgi:site-specific recombinase XerD